MNIKKVAVVGLGYVGLPLAVALANHFSVIGFDVNEKRIAQLREGIDHSCEISSTEMAAVKMELSADPAVLRKAQCIIICVPTPIDQYNKPDLFFMESASKLVGENISLGTIVVYESTVYPGVTEEVCVPILEKSSGLKCGAGFSVGYSPERINPGDKEHSIHTVVKIVSGMDTSTLDAVDAVYSTITKTHRAASIKVAEAAKVIENIQRDLNIALMNELALIFHKMDIDVYDVLHAAGTKWNFHAYHPGLVGGHCIGVDPYYLTYKAQGYGYHPEVILAGRRINDNMHKFYAERIIKMLRVSGGKQVLIAGLTFKPNVPDYRNSRVKYLIKELQDYNFTVYGYDPMLEKEIVEKEFGVTYVEPDKADVDLVVLAVDHTSLGKMYKSGLFGERKVVRLRDLHRKM